MYQRGAGALPFFSAIKESISSGNNWNFHEEEKQLQSLNIAQDLSGFTLGAVTGSSLIFNSHSLYSGTDELKLKRSGSILKHKQLVATPKSRQKQKIQPYSADTLMSSVPEE